MDGDGGYGAIIQQSKQGGGELGEKGERGKHIASTIVEEEREEGRRGNCCKNTVKDRLQLTIV